MPCSDYSFCCPNWVYPQQGTHPQQGTPQQDTSQVPPGRVPPSRVPPSGNPSPLAGYPLGRVPPSWTWQGTPPQCLPHGILGNVAKLFGIWVPPLWTDRLMGGWMDGQMHVKTLPSHRTTYMGSNNSLAMTFSYYQGGILLPHD